jgi:hypothetical protein
MLETINDILQRTWGHLYGGLTHYVPPLFVAVLILAAAWVVAHAGRFLVSKLVKGLAADRFLKRSGLSNLLRPEGDLRTGPLVARAVFWLLLMGGLLSAISVFETQWTQRIVEAVVLLAPKAATAGLIVLAGLWLSLYLSRSMLLWAAEEQLPAPRRWAAAVRAVVIFTAVVVAADVLNFAPGVFFAAFVILVGGAALAGAIAFGLGGQHAVRRWIVGRQGEAADRVAEEEASLWRHL